ncbi:MAG: hypothetical protein ABW186_16620 [Rhodanobacteraceae bacterium]
MSANGPDRDLDDLLGDDGGRVGSLYRKLPRYEPPRRLDRAVLGEAARAVHSGKPPRRQRWLVGVGSAAGLVLAAGIAWRIGHDAMNEGAMPPAAAPIVVPVQPIDGSPKAKQEQTAQPQTAPPEAPLSSAPAAQNAAAAKAVERDAIRRDERKLRTSAKAPAPPKPAESAAPEPFPAQTREREAAPVKDLEQSDAFDDSQSATGAGVAGAAAGAVAPAADKKATAPERARMPASPTVPSGSVELRRDMQLPPREWLSHIRELEQQGRHQQAIESLRLFIRAHPDRKVPADLQPLLD